MAQIHHCLLGRGGCIAGCWSAVAGDAAVVGRGSQRALGAGHVDGQRHAAACPDAEA